MSEAEGGATVHKADPAVRRNTLLLLPVIGVLLFGLWYGFQAYLDSLSMSDSKQMLASSQRVADAIDYVLYACVILLGALAAYWFRLGRTIDSAPRYPLAQTRLFHDMKILHGEAKRAYARRTKRTSFAAMAGMALLLLAAILAPRYFAKLHPIVAEGGLTEPIKLKAGPAP